MAQLQEICMNILREEGYIPSIDEDGDIRFKMQGLTLYVMTDKDDPMFLRIILPKFWEIESDEEFAKVHFVANKMNTEYKVGKVFIANNNTTAACELFISENDPEFKTIFLRILNLLTHLRVSFVSAMKE